MDECVSGCLKDGYLHSRQLPTPQVLSATRQLLGEAHENLIPWVALITATYINCFHLPNYHQHSNHHGYTKCVRENLHCIFPDCQRHPLSALVCSRLLLTACSQPEEALLAGTLLWKQGSQTPGAREPPAELVRTLDTLVTGSHPGALIQQVWGAAGNSHF